jgi:malonate-semialdehyde dehydrogenase (acetylating)/methylmalonate-semialdehyde dehydrogenase
MDALKLDDTSANPDAGMGPVIDGGAQGRLRELISAGSKTDARLVRDGRETKMAHGFFVGPTLFDEVQPGMKLFREELFGPVLAMLRPKTVEEAIAYMGQLSFGNGATIFTTNGGTARQFVREMPAGMIGVNVGVPAAPAIFSFSGWNGSFYGDLHVMGVEGVQFYTRQKMVLSRWDSTYKRSMGW